MKKIGIIVLLNLLGHFAVAQHHVPSYYHVLKTFFSKYNGEMENDNYTNFAKKRDGWYVQQIDRLKKDELISEHLFWDAATGKYRNLLSTYSVTSDTLDFETKMEPYLNYDWYNYDHIRYFGYENWVSDMINDFGNAENLSDTLLDGLGRAYDNDAYGYLWYQGGYFKGKDPLQTQLKRTEFPSKERIEKVKQSINKGIIQFDRLNTLNPNFLTIVGNANLKLFNQYMNGYNQLFMCGNENEGKKYLEKINLDERYITQAKNYLNSCDKNAILFTYGDNDTYQLWYVQEKLGYRKDITVINNSLLGMPIYDVILKNNAVISFNTPAIYLADRASDIAYFKEIKEKTIKIAPSLNLHDFIRALYLKKYPISYPDIVVPSYPSKKITYTTALLPKKSISFNLGDYLFLNDYMMLDIIESNILKRPIYFTSTVGSFCEDYLSVSGIVYKLNFEKSTGDFERKNIKALEKFLSEKYIPITSNYHGPLSFVSFDGDNTYMMTYVTLIQYYLTKKDMINAKKWSNLLFAGINDFSINQVPAFRNLANLAILTGNNAVAKKIIEMDAQYTFDAYQNPSSLKGFVSMKTCVKSIQQLLLSLQKINESSTIIAGIFQKLQIE